MIYISKSRSYGKDHQLESKTRPIQVPWAHILELFIPKAQQKTDPKLGRKFECMCQTNKPHPSQLLPRWCDLNGAIGATLRFRSVHLSASPPKKSHQPHGSTHVTRHFLPFLVSSSTMPQTEPGSLLPFANKKIGVPVQPWLAFLRPA